MINVDTTMMSIQAAEWPLVVNHVYKQVWISDPQNKNNGWFLTATDLFTTNQAHKQTVFIL